MWDDPIVSEVRTIREQLSAKFDFEINAIFADLRRRQVALGDRLVHPSKDAEANEVKQPRGSEVSR